MKQVVVLSASPRIGGNSDVLCDEFIKGAIAAGHQVEKVQVCNKHIKYCIGCGNCQKNGTCIHKDDMDDLMNQMIQADVIVMATPVYFYNMNGQLKTLIDRTCPRYMEMGHKDYYIIMSAAEEDKAIMNHVLESFQGFFDCLDEPNLAGVLYGLGAYEVGDIKESNVMQEAYTMGKSL